MAKTKIFIFFIFFISIFLYGCLSQADKATPEKKDKEAVTGVEKKTEESGSYLSTLYDSDNASEEQIPGKKESSALSLEDLKKSVVYIKNSISTCCDVDNNTISYEVSGSGVVYLLQDKKRGVVADFSDDTVIITNAHIIDCTWSNSCTFANKQDISITTYGGQVYKPTNIYYASDNTDIAFLTFRRLPDEAVLQQAVIDESHLPNSGDDVYAIGNPGGGFRWTVTTGIVSGVGNNNGLSVIQTDSAINPGNSGGGLFDKKTGTLLGINTWKYFGKEGLGFAIDARQIKDFYSMAAVCKAGSVLLNNKCVKCSADEIIDSKGKCIKACYFDYDSYSFFYCTEGNRCNNGICTPCQEGYIQGADTLCHKECGEGTGNYCIGTAQCFRGNCLVCPEGYALDNNGFCAPW